MACTNYWSYCCNEQVNQLR